MTNYTSMALSNKELKRFKNKLLDGIIPVCPSCGSSIHTEEKQKGESTSLAVNYRCTRDGLKEDEYSLCELEPDTAYSPWYIANLLLLRNRTVQLVMTALLALLVGNNWDWALQTIGLKSEDPSELYQASIKDDTGFEKPLENKNIGLLQSSLNKERDIRSALIKENKALKAQLPSVRELFILGMALVNGNKSTNRYFNKNEGQTLLFTALENDTNHFLQNNDVSEGLRKLSLLTAKGVLDTTELFRLEKLISQNDDWDQSSVYLGKTYYNLGRSVAADRRIAYRKKALAYYYCYKTVLFSRGEKLEEASLIEMENLLNILEHNKPASVSRSEWISKNEAKYATLACG